MIGSIEELVRGPSKWKIDNRQGDYNFTRQYANAAPLTLNIPKCRKNNISIATGQKKIICCNRKDPTFCLFLRNFDNDLTIENQISVDQIGNKIIFNDTKVSRIDYLMIFCDLAGSFLCILYKIFFEYEKNNAIHQTSQIKKHTTQPSIVALGIRIIYVNFILERDCLVFSCISAIMSDETKISEKNLAVKRGWCQHIKVGYTLSCEIFTLDGDNFSNFQSMPLVIQRPFNCIFLRNLGFSFFSIDFVFQQFVKNIYENTFMTCKHTHA